MFLTFWLRTENTYYNVKSNLTETAVFKREIKTDFIQGKDELISGKFSKISRSIYERLFFKVLQVLRSFTSILFNNSKTSSSEQIWMVQGSKLSAPWSYL